MAPGNVMLILLRRALHSGAEEDEAGAQASDEMLKDVMIRRSLSDSSRHAPLFSHAQPLPHPLKQKLLFNIYVWIHKNSLPGMFFLLVARSSVLRYPVPFMLQQPLLSYRGKR